MYWHASSEHTWDLLMSCALVENPRRVNSPDVSMHATHNPNYRQGRELGYLAVVEAHRCTSGSLERPATTQHPHGMEFMRGGHWRYRNVPLIH